MWSHDFCRCVGEGRCAVNKFDVIVIGSGLGGLATGVILAKEGLHVAVVERDRHVGGCLRSFQRGNAVFDTGMHYVGSINEGEILHHFFTYAGIADRLHMQRLDAEGFDRVMTPEGEYRFAQGYDAFVDTLAELFPESLSDLKNYAGALQNVGKVIGVDKLRRGLISEGGMPYLGLSASGEIARLISDERLRRVVASTNFLYDGIRDFSPFYTHAMINHSFICGAYRFVDGSQQLADLLAAEIRACGGEVLCDSEVQRVDHADNAVRGVTLASGESLIARKVVSDIDPRALLPMIGAGTKIRPTYFKRINAMPCSWGVFSVYVTLESELFPYRNYNAYIVEQEEVWGDRARTYVPRTIMVSMQAQSSSVGDEVLSMLMPCPASEFEPWSATRSGQRGAEYRQHKDELAQWMISKADAYLPGLKRAVKQVYTASPLTFRDYTGIVDGSAYGMLNDCQCPLETILCPQTKLGGLYLTGQNLNNHGALGVVMTSIATAGEILGVDYVARKIGNHSAR